MRVVALLFSTILFIATEMSSANEGVSTQEPENELFLFGISRPDDVKSDHTGPTGLDFMTPKPQIPFTRTIRHNKYVNQFSSLDSNGMNSAGSKSPFASKWQKPSLVGLFEDNRDLYSLTRKPSKQSEDEDIGSIGGTNIQLDLSVLHNMLKTKGVGTSLNRESSMGKLHRIGRR